MVRAIIPCAGLGTRMNMAIDKSKEMLIDPNTSKPIIDYSLEICRKYGLTPLVITRAEKKDLISYLQQNNIEYKVINPEGEWASTILQSQFQWWDKNILLLPDTRFSPDTVISEMKASLELGASEVYALHQVEKPSNWGIVQNYSVAEKPNANTVTQFPCYAWGVIGFSRGAGFNLFDGMTKRGTFRHINNGSFLFLDRFIDITRTGILEKY